MINSLVSIMTSVADGVDNWGYGFGLQYERQMDTDDSKMSVAGRFAITGIGIGIEDEDTKELFELGMTAFVIEAHGRLYPTRKSFYVDGHLGYGNFGINAKITDVSGKVDEEKPSQSYLTLGGRLGWRKVFGKNGGFVIDYAIFGYDFAFAMGKFKGLEDEDGLDEALTMLGGLFLLGGPRTSLSFGWQF